MNCLEKLKENLPLAKVRDLHPTVNAMIVVFAIIMIWHGVWGLLDVYLFPNTPTMSALVSVVLGGLILYLDDFSLKDLKR